MSFRLLSFTMEDHPARRCHTFQKTRPGFTMKSEKYSLKFMSSCSFGVDVAQIDELGDWRCFMRMVLREAENSQDDMDTLKTELGEKIREKIVMTSPFSPLISVYDEPYFPRPRGQMKRIKIEMADRFNTSVELCLIKITSMASLRDLCIGAVSGNIKNGLDINRIEVPETLREKVRKEYYNQWCCKRFPSYNIHVLPLKEAKKRKLVLNLERERQPKRPHVTLHRVRV